jgi:hypothetical protein
MLLSRYLLEIAHDLNDAEPGHEFSRWGQPQLLAWVNEAQCNAFTLRPDAFVHTVVMKLAPGSDQKPCDCTVIRRIVGQVDAQGNLLGGYLPKRSDVATYRWSKPGCPAPTSGPFRLTGYNQDPLENGLFRVVPPVPPGQDVYLKLTCTSLPAPLSMGDLDLSTDDCRIITASKQWVLFRALMRDDTSTTNVQVAQVHAQLFFNLLDVQFTKAIAMQLGISSPAKTAKVISTGGIGDV